MRYLLLVACLIIPIISQAQLLDLYEVTPQQRTYLEWITAKLILGNNYLLDVYDAVKSKTDARPETIRLKWFTAKNSHAQLESIITEWRKMKHPAPFHQTDSLFGDWIKQVDTLVLGYLEFYSEPDTLHPRSKPTTFDMEQDPGLVLMYNWTGKHIDLQSASFTVIKMAQLEAIGLPPKKK